MEIVFPNRNEEEFIEMALKLGHKEICFAYKEEQIPKEKPKTKKIGIKTAILNPKNPAKARKKADLLIADKSAREAFEKLDIDMVFGLEKNQEKDFMKQKNSGLNQVLCKIASKKGKTYGFNFNDVLNSKNRHLIMGRMMQNKILCQKYNVKTMMFSGATEPYGMRKGKDLEGLFRLLWF